MLPVPKDGPASVIQRLCVPLVPQGVSFELFPPIGAVLAGDSAVVGAAVPETAIDKDRDLLTGKDDIGGTAQLLQGPDVLSEPQSHPVQERADRLLGAGVPSSIPDHLATDLG